MLEDLHIGAPVRSSDGGHLGSLTRIVVEPSSQQATHLIVDPGLVESGNLLRPGGWETPRERVVPVNLVEATTRDEVRLSVDEAGFQQLQLFERKQYTDMDGTAATGAQDQWQSRFQLGELLNFVASGWGLGAAPYVAPADISLNETATSVTIEEGSKVWRVEPHEEVGTVERVLADATTQHVRALVVRRSGLRGHRVVLPVERVRNFDGSVVHIALTPAEVDALALYKEES